MTWNSNWVNAQGEVGRGPSRKPDKKPFMRHKSVMRIEQAKQMALFGSSPIKQVQHKGMNDNWTREDAVALKRLIGQWDRDTGLKGLNALIDNYRFSDGTHNEVLAR